MLSLTTVLAPLILFMMLHPCAYSPHVRESKTFLDSIFHAVESGYLIPDSFSVNLDSEMQLLVGFQIP